MSGRIELAWATPATWVEAVEAEPTRLLSDHAHCELKAAASAQTLIAKNPARTELVHELVAIAQEELQHFGLVLAELERRGGALGRTLPNPYAEGLHALPPGPPGTALLDRLLVAGLIEARSLERFLLLSEHLRDRGLAALYGDLCASEARHQVFFVRQARELHGDERVDARLAELVAHEGRLMGALAFDYRMHSGAPRE